MSMMTRLPFKLSAFPKTLATIAEMLRHRRRTLQVTPIRHISFQNDGIAAPALTTACALLLATIALIFFDQSLVLISREGDRQLLMIFASITKFGKSSWFLVPAGAALLVTLFIDLRLLSLSSKALITRAQCHLAFIFFAIAGSGILIQLLKFIFGRARPKYFETLGAFDFNLFAGFSGGFSSFPSGHSATAGATAIALGYLASPLRLPFFACGCIIAMSRVVIGAHYLSDIICGFLFGAVFASLCAGWFARRRLGFRINEEGKVYAQMRGWPLVAMKKILHKL